MPVNKVSSVQEFNDILLKTDPNHYVLVDFYATWCAPCKRIAPKLEHWSEKYTKFVFLKVDVDLLPEISKEYNITAMPTILIFKGGETTTSIRPIVGANEKQIGGSIEMLSNNVNPSDDF